MAIKSFRTVGFSLLMVFMLAFVAACNGDDDDADVADDNGNGDSVTVEAPDMSFDPDEISASAGQDLEVTLDNTDGQTHTFTLDEADFEIEAAGGESETGTLTVPDEAGDYEFYCAVPGHREAGQVGTLTVE
jgi:plastocyanin